MALIPEFVSILRYIRDTVYPSVNKTYENAVDLNKEITTKKIQFDGDYSQFKNNYVDFNNSKIEISNAVISTNQSAQSASASALLATQKSNEIKNLTAQGQTLTAGSQAYASFNPADGKLTIGIPAGFKGDKGDSFTINSSGTTAQRALYNNQIKGWSFLDLETSTIYFKVSNDSADWSLGAPFGKGDTGHEGPDGVGIVSFTFVSTTDSSGLPAQSGATDTYRITLTNSNTFDYQIYNGVDADSDFILGELSTLNSEVEQLIEDTSGLSNINAPYNLLKGEIYADNTVLKNGFSTTLYSGTSANTNIVTDIDMDTQWGDTSNEKFGGLVWIKSRTGTQNNVLCDTVRGNTKYIQSNTTNIESVSSNLITSFNNNGISLSSDNTVNGAFNYVSWNFQTTHRKTGVTNHGKEYTEHYNPFTGFTIIKYEGSGLAGHEIPHSLGRKLGFVTIKILSSADRWVCQYRENNLMVLNTTTAETLNDTAVTSFDVDKNICGVNSAINSSASQYIMYGWANSYLDESNKLIGNYEVGVYQGTGASSNKVKTRGKPAWIMVKRLDSTGSWTIIDNQRGINPTKALYSDLSTAEASPAPTNYIAFDTFGFTINSITSECNASGGQYLYMVVYDNNNGSGKSKYNKTTKSTNIQINNALIPLAHGVNNKGYKNSIVVANETITGLTYADGINYIYRTDVGYGVKKYKPRYLKSELIRNYAGESPDYYNAETNKWYNTDAGSELISNGAFTDVTTTGWNTTAPSTLSVSSGVLSFTRANTGSFGFNTSIATVIGKKYKIRCSIISNTNVMSMQIGTELGASDILYKTTPSAFTGFLEYEFLALSTTAYIIIGVSNYANIKVDNISVFQVDIVPTTEITESRNYLNHIVNADQNGKVTYVKELPKIEYKDVIKADEYLGKNACTAWVNFDGTTTPPTIRESYNVSSVIRTSVGTYDIYFEKPMDNINYCTSMSTGGSLASIVAGASIPISTLKQQVFTNNLSAGTYMNSLSVNVQIFGGKNV